MSKMDNSEKIGSLRWAFSPCPNDTFIFGALTQGLLPQTDGITPRLEDIDRLNALALQGDVDVVKVSAAMYPAVNDKYQVLPCGGAMGEGVGPLLVRREDDPHEVSADSVVAHPGKYTTAYALFRLFHPAVTQLRTFVFSAIENAVLRNDTTHGLLIHEGRFTYRQRHLFAEEDLGDRWRSDFSLPLPLGLILIKRTLPEETKLAVRDAISASLNYAWAHPAHVMPYVAAHAQEMAPDVQKSHIQLYVNQYSLTIGAQGERALQALWAAVARDGNPMPLTPFFRE